MKVITLLIGMGVGVVLGLILRFDIITSASCTLDCNKNYAHIATSEIDPPHVIKDISDLEAKLSHMGVVFDIAALKPIIPSGHDYIIACYYPMSSSMGNANLLIYQRSKSAADRGNYVRHCFYMLRSRAPVTCRVSLLGLLSVDQG